jgi:hypothetical protein
MEHNRQLKTAAEYVERARTATEKLVFVEPYQPEDVSYLKFLYDVATSKQFAFFLYETEMNIINQLKLLGADRAVENKYLLNGIDYVRGKLKNRREAYLKIVEENNANI